MFKLGPATPLPAEPGQQYPPKQKPHTLQSNSISPTVPLSRTLFLVRRKLGEHIFEEGCLEEENLEEGSNKEGNLEEGNLDDLVAVERLGR